MKQIFTLLFSFLMLSGVYATDVNPVNLWDDVDSFNLSVSLYPNPSDGVAYLEIKSDDMETFNVKVLNLIGQEVSFNQVQANERFQLDLRNMPSGVYFVQIEKGDEKTTKRLIIK